MAALLQNERWQFYVPFTFALSFVFDELQRHIFFFFRHILVGSWRRGPPREAATSSREGFSGGERGLRPALGRRAANHPGRHTHPGFLAVFKRLQSLHARWRHTRLLLRAAQPRNPPA